MLPTTTLYCLILCDRALNQHHENAWNISFELFYYLLQRSEFKIKFSAKRTATYFYVEGLFYCFQSYCYYEILNFFKEKGRNYNAFKS